MTRTTTDALDPRIDAYRFYEDDWDGYDDLYEAFEHDVPERFNVATYVLDRWAEADPDRVAVFFRDSDGSRSERTYGRLRSEANRLAGFLDAEGVGRGDRIAVNGSQRPELLVGHLAAWKLGAVTVPLSNRYGADELASRLDGGAASATVVDRAGVEAFREVGNRFDALGTVVTVDAEPEGDEVAFGDAIAEGSDEFETADTDAGDAAVIVHTSGTTGPPKGVVHAHRNLLGILPGFVTTFCDMEITDDDVARRPVEWSWAGSLNDLVLPSLYYGIPVVAHAGDGFDPEVELEVLSEFGVTITGGPATAQRTMMRVDASAYDLTGVRCIAIGGEALGETLVEWMADTYGDAVVHEAYGQTEAPLSIGDCEALSVPHRPGFMGKPHPGHEVAVLDVETREPLPAGEVGELALRYEGNPECFIGFWNDPELTAARIHEGWLLTDDLGSMAGDGYVSYYTRKEDVITSSGRRIDPDAVEDAVAAHGSVAAAGVIGVPDGERGEVPKAFVVLHEGHEPSEALVGALRGHLKTRLAEGERPREFEFVDELPLTTTGKVRRLDLREREGVADGRGA